MRYCALVDDKEYSIDILDDHTVRLGDRTLHIDFTPINGQPVYSLIADGKSFEAYVYPEENGWQVLMIGREYRVQVIDEREARLGMARTASTASSREFILKAPMPGLVVATLVKEGQAVKKGQVLLILESMKMQNELRSARDGIVTSMRAKPGDNVNKKQILMSVN